VSSISVSDSTKSDFDDLQPDDLTQDEFVGELLDAYRRDNGQVVDVDSLVDRISKQTASSIELASYRGTRDALEDYYKE